MTSTIPITAPAAAAAVRRRENTFFLSADRKNVFSLRRDAAVAGTAVAGTAMIGFLFPPVISLKMAVWMRMRNFTAGIRAPALATWDLRGITRQ